MIINYNKFIKNLNEEAAPRIPNSPEYWVEKLGKKGKDVMIYTHDDMDGIFSAIAIKKYLKDKGFNIIGYGVVNYQEGWDVFDIDKDVINVAVDFAETHPDIDVYIDHHGEFVDGDKEHEAAKKLGAVKTETSSAYEGIMDQLGLPVDSLVLDVINMIDAAKYDDYGVKWTDLLDFDLEEIKNKPKAKLLFAATFNQLLKRSDYRTIIEVIHNVDEPSIYKIFSFMKKLYPGNNPMTRRGESEEDYGLDYYTSPDYKGKDFIEDSKWRINQMKQRTRGKDEFKGIINSMDEFLQKFTEEISYPEDSRSRFAGMSANVIKLDGYCIIGELAFVGSGTWANALRARAIIQQDIESGRLPKEAENIKWVFLQYGDTLQVASYGNINEYEDYELPKTKNGKPINNLKKFCAGLLDNFKNKLNFKNENTMAGGHPGIGTISNIGTKTFDVLSSDKNTKYLANLRYLDLFKNYIIKSLSKVPWRLDLSWENPFSNTREEEPVPVDARVMKINQIRNIDKETGEIKFPPNYDRKESMKTLKKNAADLKQMEKQIEELKKKDQIEEAKAKHEYYRTKDPNDKTTYEEWSKKQKEEQVEDSKKDNNIEYLKDTLKDDTEIEYTKNNKVVKGKIKDTSDKYINIELDDNENDKIMFNDLLNDDNFNIIKENLNNIFNKKYTYEDKVKSDLIDVLMDEKNISEKSFNEVDNIVEYVNTIFKNNKQIEQIIYEFEITNKREKYCAEFIYENVIKNE